MMQMIQKIYQKLQTREGLFFVVSLAIIIATIAFIFGKFDRGYDNSFPGTITVSGTAETSVTPDIARFTFSVSRDAATIAEARAQSAEVTNPLLEKLKTAGIADRDIKTESFGAYPKYEDKSRVCVINYCPPSNPVIVGYTVTTTYSVKVRDLDQVSSIAALITETGISSLNGPDFEIDDIEKVRNQVRGQAIADARAQSRVLANQLGIRLGKIIDFQVSGQGGYYPIYAEKSFGAGNDATSSVPDLPAGEQNVKVDVTVTYRVR